MQRFTLLSTILLAGLGAEASPLVPVVQQRAPAKIQGYTYQGCFTEATNMRALSGSAFFDDRLTIQKCATACSDFKYFGVEYGRECYCGNALNQGSIEAPQASDCSFTCPGDPSQDCGAGNRLNVYQKISTPTPQVPANPPTITHVSRGCYAEPEGWRALNAKELRTSDMTIQKCADFCQAAGYSLFGLEYYTECYCGNVLMPGAQKADESGCRFPCAGDQTEICGGDWRLNLYEFQTVSGSTSSSSTSVSAPAATGTPAPAPDYTSQGCYTEASGKRALSEVSFYDDALTVARCATVCSSYELFGVEFGRECFCGDALNAGSEPAPIGECNMPCAGKGTETCGAGNRLNVYRHGAPVATTTSTSSSSSSTTSSTTSSSSTSSTLTTSSTSTSTTTSSTPTSTTTTSTSTTTTSSSTTSSSTTATPTPTEPPSQNLVPAGDFETVNDPLTKWIVKTPAVTDKTSFSLQQSAVVRTGSYAASFTWLPGATLNAYSHWIVHKLDSSVYLPGRTYKFVFTGKANINAGNPYQCGFLFEILESTGWTTVAPLGRVYGFQTSWVPVQGYSSAPAADLYFSVKTFCYGTVAAPATGITLYLDNVSLTPQ